MGHSVGYLEIWGNSVAASSYLSRSSKGKHTKQTFSVRLYLVAQSSILRY